MVTGLESRDPDPGKLGSQPLGSLGRATGNDNALVASVLAVLDASFGVAIISSQRIVRTTRFAIVCSQGHQDVGATRT